MTNYSSLKDHVNAEYLGNDGLIVDLKPNAIGNEDNPHYFTMIYLKLAEKLGCPDDSLRERYMTYINDCVVDDFGRKVLGLYHRFPYNSDNNGGYWRNLHVGSIRISSQEELMAIAFMGRGLAALILNYGRENGYSWDNRCPNEWTFRGFLARFLEFVPFLKARAEEKLSFLDKLMYAAVVLGSLRKEKGWTNGRIKIWVTSLEMRDHNSLIVRTVLKIFLSHMKKMYGDLSGLFAIYFGKTHPFTVWTKNVDF